MRTFALLTTLMCLSLAALAGPGEPARDADAERLAGLVKQLGADTFAERDAATRELVAAGEKALPALRGAAAGRDAEARRRARAVIRAIIQASRTSKSTGLELALIDSGEF